MSIDKLNRDESLFFSDIPKEKINYKVSRIIEELKDYSINNSKQVYILNKALGVKKPYKYDLDEIAYVLIPNHPILILGFGDYSNDSLEEFYYDFKEDLGHLSDKYNYDKILGRPRKWSKSLIVYNTISHFDIHEYLKNRISKYDTRKIDLLISLLIGSINNVDIVGESEPSTILDKIKQKIVLFDGKQSRFIYQSNDSKRIVIQGMAGTGKTELLLHKLKDLYADDSNTSIAFTCYNKVLANEMKKRIPKFFNFMKVDEQIDWENRLHVFSSWGSFMQPESGLYSYICNKYKIPFSNYKENRNFEELCSNALQNLNNIEDFKPCFDYTFIDESQDFGEHFFKLCEKITNKTVYIAGDIFQNIYDNVSDIDVQTSINPNFLLNKCYRTDPKTLMLAHAVGMGLYENPTINWLDDPEWVSCGYSYERKNGKFILGRSPLRRFEDLEEVETIQLISSEESSYVDKVVETIDNIIEKNPSVKPEDIGVVILGNHKTMCNVSEELVFSVGEKYSWKSSKGYETKVKSPNKLYISNINNIKGLEFPFIICVVLGRVSDNIKYRNSIYMALTRSFITSYFVVNNKNDEFIKTYKKAIGEINQYGVMELNEPSDEEKADMVNKIRISLSEQRRPLFEILDDFFTTEYPHIKERDKDNIRQLLEGKSFKWTEEKIITKARNLVEDILEG